MSTAICGGGELGRRRTDLGELVEWVDRFMQGHSDRDEGLS